MATKKMQPSRPSEEDVLRRMLNTPPQPIKRKKPDPKPEKKETGR
jgi:hypothetical protein